MALGETVSRRSAILMVLAVAGCGGAFRINRQQLRRIVRGEGLWSFQAEINPKSAPNRLWKTQNGR